MEAAMADIVDVLRSQASRSNDGYLTTTALSAAEVIEDLRRDLEAANARADSLSAEVERVRASLVLVDDEILALGRAAHINTTEERDTYGDGYFNGIYAARAITQEAAQAEYLTALAQPKDHPTNG